MKPELGCSAGLYLQIPEGAPCDIRTNHLSWGHLDRAQVGEVEHIKITASSRVLINPTWGGARNHHGNTNVCENDYECPPLHHHSSLKCSPSTTAFLKQAAHQTTLSTLHLTSSYQHMAHTRQAAAQGPFSDERYWEPQRNICEHFSITQCLMIRNVSHSRPLGPGKWSLARAFVPSCLTLSFRASSTHHSERCSQDKHTISFMFFSYIMTRGLPIDFLPPQNHAFPLLKVTLHIRKWPGPTQLSQTTVALPISRLNTFFAYPSQQWQHHNKLRDGTISAAYSRTSDADISWFVTFQLS